MIDRKKGYPVFISEFNGGLAIAFGGLK